MIGTVVEHYQILEMLGEGGMGVVYKALDLKLERYVAIKILHSQSVANPRFVERFKREARSQAKLNHPNIVPVYGFTEHRGMLGIVMEYVKGDTIEQLLAKRGRFSITEAVFIMQQVLAGISFAHEKGFVHRDMKPANIIISTDGAAKIMDFGIAKSLTEDKGITRTGAKIGTVLYMSPEQIRAEEPSVQSDIYSLGLTFYEMLSGKSPFDFPTEFEIMEAHLKREPQKLSSVFSDIPAEVDDVISRATNKSTRKRYHSCAEFLYDLEQLSFVRRTHTHRKTKTKKQEAVKPSKAGNIISFTLLISVIVALFVYFFSEISDLWEANSKSDEELLSRESYRSNPGYIPPTDWIETNSTVRIDINSIVFVDDMKGFAAGNNGIILYTADGGNGWIKLNIPYENNFHSIYFLDEKSGFAAGEDGLLIRTNNGGKSWSQINTDISATLFSVFGTPGATKIFAVGDKGSILRSTNNGETWLVVKPGLETLLYNGAFADETNGFTAGWEGVLLKTTDGGINWNKVNIGTDKYLKDIFFVNEHTGFIVGGGGEIFRTDNSGSRWQRINSGLISGLFAVKFRDSQNGFIVSNKGELLSTTNGGKDWQLNQTGKFTALNDISFTPSGKSFIAGANGIILTR